MTDNIYANNTAGDSAGALYIDNENKAKPNVTVTNDVFLVCGITNFLTHSATLHQRAILLAKVMHLTSGYCFCWCP